MQQIESYKLAQSIRKHGHNLDVLIEDIAARFVPQENRERFKALARGKTF